MIEREYRTSWVHQSYLEPQSCTAAIDPLGNVTVYASTQALFHTRGLVARALGLAEKLAAHFPRSHYPRFAVGYWHESLGGALTAAGKAGAAERAEPPPGRCEPLLMRDLLCRTVITEPAAGLP